MYAEDRLALIRVKVERANKHIFDLESACALSAGRDFHMKAFMLDSDSGSKPKLKSSDIHLYEAEIPAIAGDAIHNLRSALDHLAYHLVAVGMLHRKRRTEPIYKVQFPIFHSLKEYEAGKMRKVEGMRSKAIQAIDALKPYKDGTDALWQIHRWDILDRHRDLLGIGTHRFVLGKGFATFLYEDDPPFERIGNLQQNIDLSAQEAGDELGVGNGNTLIPTLQQFAVFVDNLICNFKPMLE